MSAVAPLTKTNMLAKGMVANPINHSKMPNAAGNFDGIKAMQTRLSLDRAKMTNADQSGIGLAPNMRLEINPLENANNMFNNYNDNSPYSVGHRDK